MISPLFCRSMARYNRWMNERLYSVCAALPDSVRKEDRNAPFRSVHGTLNHLLLADRLWLGRFTGAPIGVRSLDQELYGGFEELRHARAEMDQQIEAWAEALTETELAGELVFQSVVDQQRRVLPLWYAAQHCFNHQTHHPGQLTTLLEQLGCDFGVTDLIWMPGGPLPGDVGGAVSAGSKAEGG